MQRKVERAIAKFPQVASVFSRAGTAEVATDPMPPNAADSSWNAASCTSRSATRPEP